MDRPVVICHILMALDGKIDGQFFAAPETMPALRKYGELRKFYDCPATIYGTTTTADGDSGCASLFETGGFSSAAPVAFFLKAVEQIENDTLWLRYISKNRRTME